VIVGVGVVVGELGVDVKFYVVTFGFASVLSAVRNGVKIIFDLQVCA